jgi:hypothetical protein
MASSQSFVRMNFIRLAGDWMIATVFAAAWLAKLAVLM